MQTYMLTTAKDTCLHVTSFVIRHAISVKWMYKYARTIQKRSHEQKYLSPRLFWNRSTLQGLATQPMGRVLLGSWLGPGWCCLAAWVHPQLSSGFLSEWQPEAPAPRISSSLFRCVHAWPQFAPWCRGSKSPSGANFHGFGLQHVTQDPPKRHTIAPSHDGVWTAGFEQTHNWDFKNIEDINSELDIFLWRMRILNTFPACVDKYVLEKRERLRAYYTSFMDNVAAPIYSDFSTDSSSISRSVNFWNSGSSTFASQKRRV